MSQLWVESTSALCGQRALRETQMWLGLKAGQGVNQQSGRGEGLRPPVGEEAMGICSPSHFYTLSLASDQPSFIWGCPFHGSREGSPFCF